MATRIYLIAGEASGDLHGGNLIKALRELSADVECRAWGGEHMAAAGATVVKHYRELAFMGFWEVVKNLPAIWQNLQFCRREIEAFRPDAIVLIDYPGFNLRIARWAKRRGYRVIYYISPQLWAWHASRVRAIKRDVDQLLVILPFEVDFYQQYGVEAIWVGHPLLDAIPARRAVESNGIIALLPGSRQQEVRRILPVMLSVTPFFPEYRFVIAAAPSLPRELFHPYLAAYPKVELRFGDTYGVLQEAQAALVKSGTSTLEAALIGVPQVVCYAGNSFSYAIAKRLVRVSYISLVNLVLQRPLVRELIQGDLNTALLCRALSEILNAEQAKAIREGYEELRQRLGGAGASKRAAQHILHFLMQRKERDLGSNVFRGLHK
ncbi:MAG: lipid-A-disaccharide synthase [Saprospiraceae bacterium]|nr:lipid-A-disaccharide synthase [Saprospiraceae bacterium]MDW8482792.1 lipid-A-disaccharide synthase [Saprospiraceae bacterium]